MWREYLVRVEAVGAGEQLRAALDGVEVGRGGAEHLEAAAPAAAAQPSGGLRAGSVALGGVGGNREGREEVWRET